MKKPTKRINVTFGTDFHFGHRRTPSYNTLKGVKAAWPDTDALDELDMFIIGGDWMDRQITLSQVDAYIAEEACIYILSICAKHDIILIVVEGTTSHDRRQSIMFTELNERLGIGCHLIYRQELCVEYIESLGIHVLLVPDEYSHDAEITYRHAKQLLTNKGITQADIAVVHSGFKYQFPIDMPSLFDEAKWSELVVYCILSGHIHNHSRCLNVICGGAFNRNRHDEDTDKGFLNLTLEDGKITHLDFIVNKYAKVYKTIPIMGLDILAIRSAIDGLGKLPEGSAIRLEYGKDDAIHAIRSSIDASYPHYEFSDIKRVSKDTQELKRLFSNTIYQPVEITPSSVTELILDRLSQDASHTPSMLQLVDKVIKDAISDE